MKLLDCNIKIRCEIPNCKQFANYRLNKEGFVKNASLFICKDCVKDIYSALGECLVPKSPNNMLNKKIPIKKVKDEING